MKETRADIEDWITDIIDNVVANCSGRKVVLWGKYDTSEKIAGLLKEVHNIDADRYIDNDSIKVDNIRVFSKEYFAGKSQEFYIAVPIGYYKAVADSLNDMGYIPVKDYYYFCDCIVRTERDYYEDRHGNIIRGIHEGIQIRFCSYNAHIEIGESAVLSNCKFNVGSNAHVEIGEGAVLKNCSLFVGSNAHVEIGKGAVLSNCNFNVSSNTHVKIGDNTVIDDNRISLCNNSNLIIGNRSRIDVRGKMSLREHAQITIGDGFTCERDFVMLAEMYSKISIGNDCMFSYVVSIYNGDGHSIFDINSRININSPREKMKNTELNIGDHVWLGIKSTILGNTKIGNGSMVGAASLVKGCFPNNCILAGNPARIIRKDIAWSRENCAEDILQCGYENINLTQEQENVKKNPEYADNTTK